MDSWVGGGHEKSESQTSHLLKINKYNRLERMSNIGGRAKVILLVHSTYRLLNSKSEKSEPLLKLNYGVCLGRSGL